MTADDTGDVLTGLTKCIAYGAAIPIVSGYCGLSTFGGSEGVGWATTRAVVNSSLAIIVFTGDKGLQQSVAAVMGNVKLKCRGQSLRYAIDFFYDNYVGKRYIGEVEATFRSVAGQAYVRTYLERWFR